MNKPNIEGGKLPDDGKDNYPLGGGSRGDGKKEGVNRKKRRADGSSVERAGKKSQGLSWYELPKGTL